MSASAPAANTKTPQTPTGDGGGKTLVIDVGGTHVKILVTGETMHREFSSGPALTAEQMVAGVKQLAGEWKYDQVSIGYPGPIKNHRPSREPHNLGPGWVQYDYAKAFGRPVRMINDAAMQALGGYNGGTMLFLGLGTGLGTTVIADNVILPMELGHLPYRKATYEDYVGVRGRDRFGKKRWRKCVRDVVALLVAALVPDDVVLGGGNVKQLKELPPGCREGDNANAFIGGFRLWADKAETESTAAPGKGAAAATKRSRGQTKARGGRSGAAKTKGKSA